MRVIPHPRGIALAVFFLFALQLPLVASAQEDPLEGVNRVTHQFNRGLDRIILKPAARTYQKLTPRFIRTGVRNFFSNLDDVSVTVNDLLQLNFEQAASDFGRLAINSTIGLGGVIDVATPALGLEKNRQDFGMTLAHYGVESGPYVVLPLLGPSTLRDAFAMGLDASIDPVPSVDHPATRNGLMSAEAVNFRAGVLGFDDLIIGDDYLFIRGAYLQQRDYVINGGGHAVAFEDF